MLAKENSTVGIGSGQPSRLDSCKIAIEKANKLRELGINPYANNSCKDTTIKKFLNVNSDVYQLENKRDEKRDRFNLSKSF